MNSKSYECCILGAGPAGLGAALELVKHGITDILIIDRNKVVGGLARTEVRDGTRFDIGPHRFFAKSKKINKIWHDTLGTDFKRVFQLTRVFYKEKYFNYPIRPFDALVKLGPLELLTAITSFLASQLTQKKKAVTFEDWIIQKFGRKLYETFFKRYTEKVWGIPCNQIGAEWATQRIKDLDPLQVLRNSLLGVKNNKIKSLVKSFDYPVLGAGQMYQAMCDSMVSKGVEIMLDSSVIKINRNDTTIKSIDIERANSECINVTAKYFFSSIPLKDLFSIFHPRESFRVIELVQKFWYRDHITVDLLIGEDNLFPDQWIYVHSPDIQMARLVNYNNFSKAMVGYKNKSALSVEYFVFYNRGLWNESDDFLKDLAVTELDRMGLVRKNTVEKSWVTRETKAYPIIYAGFQKCYEALKPRINQFTNLCPIGRGGMHKYNNQDHSIMSGILAVRNYLQLPGSPYNLWAINIDSEYHES